MNLNEIAGGAGVGVGAGGGSGPTKAALPGAGGGGGAGVGGGGGAGVGALRAEGLREVGPSRRSRCGSRSFVVTRGPSSAETAFSLREPRPRPAGAGRSSSTPAVEVPRAASAPGGTGEEGADRQRTTPIAKT